MWVYESKCHCPCSNTAVSSDDDSFDRDETLMSNLQENKKETQEKSGLDLQPLRPESTGTTLASRARSFSSDP